LCWGNPPFRPGILPIFPRGHFALLMIPLYPSRIPMFFFFPPRCIHPSSFLPPFLGTGPPARPFLHGRKFLGPALFSPFMYPLPSPKVTRNCTEQNFSPSSWCCFFFQVVAGLNAFSSPQNPRWIIFFSPPYVGRSLLLWYQLAGSRFSPWPDLSSPWPAECSAPCVIESPTPTFPPPAFFHSRDAGSCPALGLCLPFSLSSPSNQLLLEVPGALGCFGYRSCPEHLSRFSFSPFPLVILAGHQNETLGHGTFGPVPPFFRLPRRRFVTPSSARQGPNSHFFFIRSLFDELFLIRGNANNVVGPVVVIPSFPFYDQVVISPRRDFGFGNCITPSAFHGADSRGPSVFFFFGWVLLVEVTFFSKSVLFL